MLEVWLKAKDESRLILGLRDYGIKNWIKQKGLYN